MYKLTVIIIIYFFLLSVQCYAYALDRI